MKEGRKEGGLVGLKMFIRSQNFCSRQRPSHSTRQHWEIQILSGSPTGLKPKICETMEIMGSGHCYVIITLRTCIIFWTLKKLCRGSVTCAQLRCIGLASPKYWRRSEDGRRAIFFFPPPSRLVLTDNVIAMHLVISSEMLVLLFYSKIEGSVTVVFARGEDPLVSLCLPPPTRKKERARSIPIDHNQERGEEREREGQIPDEAARRAVNSPCSFR